ncbi:MAG: DUF87 domain-containing protein [Acidobacteriota bacterium]
MQTFFNQAAQQTHPLRILKEFLERETANEIAKKYSELRFVGYVLDIGYDTITIITSDPFKIAVGGVPRNSLLIMTPALKDSIETPHFTLLRVLDSAPTPLSKETQQTYFELQKKSMPELDRFTQAELQWGALTTGVLGMFYPHPHQDDTVEFSGDVNNFVSAHKYKVYAPDDNLLNLVINSLVATENQFPIGNLRLTECRLPLPNKAQPKVDVCVSTTDFLGARTAMFGKTRLGKSNVVKLLAQSLLETYQKRKNEKQTTVGQLIFDINGEYANDNPQNTSLPTVYPDRCEVYALTKKEKRESKPLKLNFYEQPDSSQGIIYSFLAQDNRLSGYVASYASVELPALDEVYKMPPGGERNRAVRKIQMFWAILFKAGFQANETRLQNSAPTGIRPIGFNPNFNQNLRMAVYRAQDASALPAQPQNLSSLQQELENINRFRRDNPNHAALISTGSGGSIFDTDDIHLLEFLEPQTGRSGTSLISPYRRYHDPNADNFVRGVLQTLDEGQTVILDLGNAHPTLRDYFSDMLSNAVFEHQVEKFSNDRLGNHFIQIYFEEAHNLFPRHEDPTKIYNRFAKEGAKYQIGMVYSTQSPTTVNGDLLAQTENFFIAHLSSQDEVNALAKMNVAYESLKDDILRAKTPGYIRMLTRSHRFVVPVQAFKFEPKVQDGK